MLFLYNQTFTENDLKSCYFEYFNKTHLNLVIKYSCQINNVHIYVLQFFQEKQIISKRPWFASDSPHLFLNTLFSEPKLSQDEFRYFVHDRLQLDQNHLSKLQKLLKMNLQSSFKDLKKQILDCEIEAYLGVDPCRRNRVLTLFDQEFLFKNWSYDGSPYFKDWLKKNELYFIENLLRYSYI